jgi:hypothetical protein
MPAETEKKTHDMQPEWSDAAAAAGCSTVLT